MRVATPNACPKRRLPAERPMDSVPSCLLAPVEAFRIDTEQNMDTVPGPFLLIDRVA